MIDFIKRVFGLVVPYWKTKSSILSWVLLISVLFLTAGVVYLNKLFNNWYNDFYNTMQAVDESGFKRCLVSFAVLACFGWSQTPARASSHRSSKSAGVTG